jgi:hypothetical protein
VTRVRRGARDRRAERDGPAQEEAALRILALVETDG